MRKITLVLLLAIATLTGVASAQSNNLLQFIWAAKYNQWALPGLTPNTYTFNATTNCIADPYSGRSYNFNTNAPVFINDLGLDANSEIVTPTSVISAVGTCGFAASPAHSHPGFQVQSGTAGLQEAINATLGGSSSHQAVIVLDTTWWNAAASLPGTSGSAVIAAAVGSTSVSLVDITQTPWVWYACTSGGCTASTTPVGNFSSAGSGSTWTYFQKSELVTLATGATTTDTTANVLPANSVIDMVQGVVNTTITGSCTGWELGDATTAARFSANNTGLTAATAANAPAAITTGVASSTTGPYQTSAAKLRITCAGGNPSAGKIRVVVYGRTFTPPTS